MNDSLTLLDPDCCAPLGVDPLGDAAAQQLAHAFKALADPVPALACARVFPGYSVWTRSMLVDFELGGSTDLELRFAFPQDLENTIREQLARDGRATPSLNTVTS